VADLTSVERARALVLEAVQPLPGEELALSGALGRVLAEQVASPLDVPPFDSSAMDGFAVRAGPAAELELVDEARAGHPAAASVEPGTAVRISTGAPLPRGAEAVVPVERAEEPGGRRVRVGEARPGANVRRAGEDLRLGQVALEAGCALGAAELGVLASLGRDRALCARRPRVALLVTGDELAEPGERLAPGQIYSSNAAALAAQAALAGAEMVLRARVPDDRAETERTIAAALESADVLLISGGVSVGPHDHVKPALGAVGVQEAFWRVALKPGKPTWFGVREQRLVFGLPGNPVSAMVCFQLFARPALRALQGADPGAARASARLTRPLPRSPARLEAVRCRLRCGDDGLEAEPTGDQGSHRLSSMLGADCLALVEPGERELGAGERVPIELLVGSPA
jgi:molybdopterin molybdotransferase